MGPESGAEDIVSDYGESVHPIGGISYAVVSYLEEC